MVELCLLAQEMDVALESEGVSFMVVVVGQGREGQRLLSDATDERIRRP